MKPHRIRMTHNLLINYGLYQKMQIYVRVSKVVRSLILLSVRPAAATKRLLSSTPMNTSTFYVSLPRTTWRSTAGSFNDVRFT